MISCERRGGERNGTLPTTQIGQFGRGAKRKGSRRIRRRSRTVPSLAPHWAPWCSSTGALARLPGVRASVSVPVALEPAGRALRAWQVCVARTEYLVPAFMLDAPVAFPPSSVGIDERPSSPNSGPNFAPNRAIQCAGSHFSGPAGFCAVFCPFFWPSSATVTWGSCDKKEPPVQQHHGLLESPLPIEGMYHGTCACTCAVCSCSCAWLLLRLPLTRCWTRRIPSPFFTLPGAHSLSLPLSRSHALSPYPLLTSSPAQPRGGTIVAVIFASAVVVSIGSRLGATLPVTSDQALTQISPL